MPVKKISATLKRQLKDSPAKEYVKAQIIEETKNIIQSIKNNGMDPMTTDLMSLFPYLGHIALIDTDVKCEGKKKASLEQSEIRQLEAVVAEKTTDHLGMMIDGALDENKFELLIGFAYLWRFFISALSVGKHADSLFEALSGDAFQLTFDPITQEVLDEMEELVGDIRNDIFGALSTSEERERQGILVGLAAHNEVLRTYTPDAFLIRNTYELVSDLTYDSLPSWFATIVRLNVSGGKVVELSDSERIKILMDNIVFRINGEGGAELDVDNLMAFDHIKGLWTHNINEFASMWALLGGKTRDVKSIFGNIAGLTRAKPANEAYMVPYNGSRYIALRNGVLDVSNLELITFNEANLRGVTFADFQQLQINYNPDRELPIIPGGALDGGDWDPKTFFYTLSEEDPLKYKYFMFCLSLGFFPRHNFGVNVSIKGSSGSGKSTLANIYLAALSPENVARGLFVKLNDSFPLQDLTPHSSLIWLNEANRSEGISLKSGTGEPLYNSLADGMSIINVKNSKIKLVNPPQVYVEGTDLVTSSDPSNGMTRRTLPFAFAPDSFLKAEGRNGRYKAIEIERLLQDAVILEWIFNEAIKAYREVVPDHILEKDSIKLSLNNTEMLSWFDEFEFFDEWHSGVVKTNETLHEFFEAAFNAIIFMDNPDGTPDMSVQSWAKGCFISDSILYMIYEYYYESEIPSQVRAKYKVQEPTFTDQWGKFLASKGVHRFFLYENIKRSRTEKPRVRTYVGDLKSLLHSAHDRNKPGQFCFGVDYRLMIEQQSIPARAPFRGCTEEKIEWERVNRAVKLGYTGSVIKFDLENDNLSPLELALVDAFSKRATPRAYQFYHKVPEGCEPYKKGTGFDFVRKLS